MSLLACYLHLDPRFPSGCFLVSFMFKSYFGIVFSIILQNCPHHVTVLFITVSSGYILSFRSPFYVCLSFFVAFHFIHLKNLISVPVCLLISMACSVTQFLLWHVILFGGIFITEKHVLLTCWLSATPVLAALPAHLFFTPHACFEHNPKIVFS